MLFLLGYLACPILYGQEEDDAVWKHRLFPWITLVEAQPGSGKSMRESPVLRKLANTQLERAERAMSSCRTATCYARAFSWSEDEKVLACDELLAGLSKTEEKRLADRLRSSDYYSLYQDLPDSALIRSAWTAVASGMNRIMQTYVAGEPPERYAAIDSISYRTDDPLFLAKLDSAFSATLLQARADASRPFYFLLLKASLAALEVNGRDEAVRYEPLTGGLNAKALQQVEKTNWVGYPYSVLLVPGFGPESADVRLHEKGRLRCEWAAERFHKGLAPFIIVSGGHVYPFRTPLSEAVEMRRYLIEELHVPEEAILVEPHARHTTTNIRNASRLMYRFGMPEQKPGLVVTDSAQTKMIEGLSDRCLRELGYVPYQSVRVLNDHETEFLPSRNVFQVNLKDVLDP